MARKTRIKKFRYGMRLRGFSPGCQPKRGLIDKELDDTGKYYDILVYNRRLTDDEIRDYELDDLNKTARRLTIIREQKGIKQEDLAKKLGVSVRTVQGWEINTMNGVPFERVVKVAEALGVDVIELLDR